MESKKLTNVLRYAAITGNILFILWVSFNAVKEGFIGTLPEKFSYIGLMGLLMANCFLLITRFQTNKLTVIKN